MKTRTINILILWAACLMVFSSCNKNDNEVTPTVEPEKLTCDVTDTIKLGVNETSEVNILTGGGSYKVFSENPEILDTEITGTKILLKGLNKGYTAIVVSDGNNSYKRIPIKSFYKQLILDTKELKIKMKLGHSENSTIAVLGGNGGYSAKIDNETLAKVSNINGNNITIIASKAGTTNITITDMMNLSITIPINIETTTIPYTNEELETLKETSTEQYTYDGSTMKNSSGVWYSFYNQKDGDYNLYGYGYSSYQYTKIWFSGDKNVGKKSPAKFGYKTWSSSITVDPIDVEVIKNDGVHIWVIFSFIKDETLHYGNFCQKI